MEMPYKNWSHLRINEKINSVTYDTGAYIALTHKLGQTTCVAK